MRGEKLLREKLIYWGKEKGSVTAINEALSGESISYQELLYSTAAFGNYLGNKPLKIMVILPSGIIDSMVWLACLIYGHLIIPLSPAFTDFEYQESIDKHKPDLLITENDKKIGPENLKQLTATEIKGITKKGVKEKAAIPGGKRLPEGSVYLSTSGSTGISKGVILSATQIVITAENIRKSHNITESDRCLTPLPFYHVNAPVVSLMTSVLSGSTLIIAPKYSTSNFWDWVKKYDPTWISLIPTMLAMLLSTERPGFLDNSSLRFIRTASEPLPPENLKRFEEKFRIPVIETYGLSEAASTVAANPPPPGIHKAGSVGLPLGVLVKICAVSSEKILPVGETGEVCLKGSNIIKKYEDNLSAESFSKGWFRSGDLGFLDEDGYIHLTGRIKDIIIRGGENIAPREIEEVLLSYPGVREATVVGHPDPIYGEKIVAFVVLRESTDKSIKEKIRKYAAKRLAPQKMPADIYILKDLPRNKTGKVDKRTLRSFQPGTLLSSMRA